MSAPKLLSFWAPPGVGKSRSAAAAFAILKNRGFRVELVPEFAKSLSYTDNKVALADPFYVMANQEHACFQLIGKVDYIVTDGPVPMAAVYCDLEDRPQVRELAMHLRSRYRCFDVRLTRDPGRHYETYGRHHTEEESLALEAKVDRILAYSATGPVLQVRADAGAAARAIAWLDQEEYTYGDRDTI
jgi:hypothetical protein